MSAARVLTETSGLMSCGEGGVEADVYDSECGLSEAASIAKHELRVVQLHEGDLL